LASVPKIIEVIIDIVLTRTVVNFYSTMPLT